MVAAFIVPNILLAGLALWVLLDGASRVAQPALARVVPRRGRR